MSGAIFVPVCPTWSVCGRQPAMVTAREQPTGPPSRPASSSMIPNPSLDPAPRPPGTPTLAAALRGQVCEDFVPPFGPGGDGGRRREPFDQFDERLRDRRRRIGGKRVS